MFFLDEYIDQIDDDPSYNYFTPIIKECSSYISDDSVVCDVGCGNGIYSISLKKIVSCKLYGVDGSEYALEKAQSSGFDKVYYVEDFSSSRLPFADGELDFVICKDVLEHLVDPGCLVSEISRIVKVGGHVLLHVPNHFPLIGRMKFLFTNNIDTFNYFPGSSRYNFPHLRFLDFESVAQIALDHGLDYVDDFSWRFVRPSRLFKRVNSVAKHLYRFAPDQFTEGYSLLFSKNS